MAIGDEHLSGKQRILNLFTAPEIMSGEPGEVDTHLCDIQTKVVEISDKKGKEERNDSNHNSDDNYCLQLWLPECSEESAFLRPLFYRTTDAFIVIFSIKSEESFGFARDVYLPELKTFIDSFENDGEIDDEFAEFHFGIPILLVGNHAECRNDPEFRGRFVTPEDAVQLGQRYGVCNYIEISSDNMIHVHEVFRQCIIAVKNNHGESSLTDQERLMLHARENAYFQNVLTVPTPEGSFDQIDCTFSISCEHGVDYFLTIDGTSPTKASIRYSEPITFKKPFPQEIRVIGIARGRYQSEEAHFPVPRESSVPEGYFDIHTRTFRIVSRPDTVYFFTLDGTKPERETGMLYDTESDGIPLDQMFQESPATSKPNSCFVGPVRIPEMIKVIGIEKNKFKSRVASFQPFATLPTPTVSYNNMDRVLKVDALPGLVYKYTLDGTTPNWDSITYTSPVLLPSDPSITTIKVAAFPKYSFPSRVAELTNIEPVSKTSRNESSRHAVKLTNSAIVSRRAASPRSPMQDMLHGHSSLSPRRTYSSSLDNNDTMHIHNNNNSMWSTSSPGKLLGFGSGVDRGLYNRSPLRERTASPHRSPRLVNSEGGTPVRKQRILQAPLTIKEQESLVKRKALFKRKSSNSSSPLRGRKSQEFHVNAARIQHVPGDTANETVRKHISNSNNELVQCKAEGANVEFSFAKPVRLSNVYVKTPGNEQGPTGYRCFVVDEENASVTNIGEGDLDDRLGMQRLLIDPSKYPGQVFKLLCNFKMAPGQTSFKILDMKVDCKKL